ncbi:MAG: hypothetical protein ABJN26_19065 [Stappiaceae bacterium]
MLSDPELWNRIEAVVFDEANCSFPFSARLARENNWNAGEALAAIDEYKKFVYLAKCCDHPVTPSVEVDQVWHLHLTYTRHYWGVFSDALGAPLHHDPTVGGRTEQRKFENFYRATLKLYEREFGTPAPDKFWPNVTVRFAPAPTRSGDNRTFTIPLIPIRDVPKALLRSSLALLTFITVLLAASGIATAHGSFSGENTFDALLNSCVHIFNKHFTEAVAVAGGVLVGGYLLFRSKQGRNGGDSGCGSSSDSNGSGCSSGCAGGD